MLKSYPKEIILKDGTGVTVRFLQEGDEGALLEMYRRFPEEERWFLENDVQDPSIIKRWVETADVKRLVSLVAVLENRIIAHATIIRKYYGARAHIGKIRISVDPAFRERHLGTWMLLDLHNAAISLGLKILEMRLVRGRQSHVVGSSKRLGFREEATIREYLMDRAGNAHDLVIMVKRLRGTWEEPAEIIPGGEWEA